MLQKSIKSEKRFLDLFYEPEIESHSLTQKTKLSLFVLRIDGSNFDYSSLKTELGNAAVTYVLSRNVIEGMNIGNSHEYVKRAQDAFRKAEEKSGEGGELFLYCFLETHLNAPKILSKMELKTAGNDYIKGSDGIHLLDLGQGKFHLIFGESKMISDSTEKDSSFRKAIGEALGSVKKIQESGFGQEIALVDSNLMKESFPGESLNYLKRIIKPSALDKDFSKDNAFGIFIGFEVDIEDWDLQEMSDDDFKSKIRTHIKVSVESKYDYIKEQIKKEGLTGYHFYIYAVPFIKKGSNSITKVRQEIVAHVKNEKFS